MEHPALDLAGVLPPITTPFDERGDLDLEALAANIVRYNGAGLRGYVAFGSNGEAAHLTAAERRRVLVTLRQTAARDHVIVAGVNELSTRAAIAATREAAEGGADAALVITPYFYKGAMTQDLLSSFYLEVADASTLPVLIYNVPQNTGVAIEPATIAALAETIRRSNDGFQVLVGNAGIFYPALLMGAAGGVLALACAAPEACVEIQAAATAGDHQRARELQNRLAAFGRMVTVELGVAGLKAALDLAGFAGGAPRGPLRPIGDADRRRLATEMRRLGLLDESPA